eukprot:sb/3473782/
MLGGQEKQVVGEEAAQVENQEGIKEEVVKEKGGVEEKEGVRHGAFTAMGLHFSVIKMVQSFILWVGHEEASLNTISTALSLPSRPPSSSRILGTQEWTTLLAQKLAGKTKHQVFIFAGELEPDEVPMCEKIIFQKLQQSPALFLTT